MNKPKLSSCMALFGDTQETLATAMGLSLSRLNAKINERDGASFTQNEMQFVIDRYSLNNDEAVEIFFTQKVT